MSEVAFLVPRRAGDPWRDRLWEFVSLELVNLGMGPVVAGVDDGPGPFSRSRAVNRAARYCDDADVFVIVDADTIPDREVLETAIAKARAESELVLGFDRLANLNRVGTERILDGFRGSWWPFVRWENTRGVSSVVVIPRDLFVEVGGFDEQFSGWGFEDRAFWLAAHAIAGGSSRVRGVAWHLWHRRSPEKDPASPGFIANRRLAELYREAHRFGREAMLELVGSRSSAPLGF